jgi:hypothetical protein
VRIAILHYHLDAGGVNRIIDLSARALTEAGHEVAVLAGGPPHARSLLDRRRVGVVPGLNYATGCGDLPSLAASLDGEARRILGGDPDLWHFHNHSLGKNPAVPMLAARWAREGRALVLQIHDFAEQDRPGNYRLLRDAAGGEGLHSFLYPSHSRVRYAVLTSHDAAIIDRAGPSSRATVLPNPVEPLPVESPLDPAGIDATGYLVYPTRAIPRKNLGEAILWSALLPEGEKLLITLAPDHPAHRAEHDAWVEFARRHRLPVLFDTVTRLKRPLGDFISGARAAITTSIGEGFGMAYLEPWLLGTPVVGRDLPKVTGDFAASGMRFDWLYPGIPVALTEAESLQYERLELESRRERARAYGLTGTDVGNGMPPRGIADFGFLPPALQRVLLERWFSGSGAVLEPPELQVARAASTLDSQRRNLAGSFSLDAYAARLEHLYRQAVESDSSVEEGSSFLDPQRVLEGFGLSVDRLP